MAGLCRLQEKNDSKMEVVCLKLLRGLHQKYKVGAVSGSTLYLTSLMPPVSGNILSVDLTRDVEPEASPTSRMCQVPDNLQDGTASRRIGLCARLIIYNLIA